MSRYSYIIYTSFFFKLHSTKTILSQWLQFMVGVWEHTHTVALLHTGWVSSTTSIIPGWGRVESLPVTSTPRQAALETSSLSRQSTSSLINLGCKHIWHPCSILPASLGMCVLSRRDGLGVLRSVDAFRSRPVTSISTLLLMHLSVQSQFKRTPPSCNPIFILPSAIFWRSSKDSLSCSGTKVENLLVWDEVSESIKVNMIWKTHLEYTLKGDRLLQFNPCLLSWMSIDCLNIVSFQTRQKLCFFFLVFPSLKQRVVIMDPLLPLYYHTFTCEKWVRLWQVYGPFWQIQQSDSQRQNLTKI